MWQAEPCQLPPNLASSRRAFGRRRDGPTDRQTGRLTGRQTERHTDRQTYRDKDRDIDRDKRLSTETHRQTRAERHTHKHKHTEPPINSLTIHRNSFAHMTSRTDTNEAHPSCPMSALARFRDSFPRQIFVFRASKALQLLLDPFPPTKEYTGVSFFEGTHLLVV